MQRLLSAELPRCVGRRVGLAGWLHRQRRLSRVTFVLIRDRAGLAQVVVEDPAVRARVAELRPETVVEVDGEVVAMPAAPGGIELHAPNVRVLAAPVESPPLELHRPRLKERLPTILDHAPVALRHERERAKAALAAASVAGFRSGLEPLGFVEIQTPKIVSSATEGGANVFQVDYFGRPAYLSQSPQLYKQVMVGVFERVYEVGPAFRAEPHETARHLAEYVSLDAELGFIDDHRTVMGVARDAVAGMVEEVGRRTAREMELLSVAPPEVPDEIPSIHFADAQALIERSTGVDVVGEPDLSPSDERWIGEWGRREHGCDFIFVVGFPMEKRPFYTHPQPGRPDFSNSFDLIFRGLEVITGGQRLHRYEDYLSALALRGLAPEPFEAYLQAFRYGMPPHGGFAIGLERWVAQLVGAANIRETALFPRDRSRLAP